MYIVGKYKINLLSLLEQVRKPHQRLALIPLSKTRTNKLYIYRQCTYIVHIYTKLSNINSQFAFNYTEIDKTFFWLYYF